MPFLADHARLLLILHTALAVGAVAASTHVVLWMRGYLSGDYRRHRGVQRLSLYAALLFAAAFVAGNLMYPTYKVQVRAEYLESGGTVIRDRAERDQARAQVRERYNEARVRRGAEPLPPLAAPAAAGDITRDAAKVARWFDVKEHWLALGLMLAVAVAVMARVWDPRRRGAGIAPAVFALAVGAALTGWIGAIIGVVVSSHRAVG